MRGAVELLRTSFPGLRTILVLPDDELVQQAQGMGIPEQIRLQVGGLTEALRETDVAIASTGTVTLECAYWGVLSNWQTPGYSEVSGDAEPSGG
jgi:lipid A disaccharide synthetase